VKKKIRYIAYVLTGIALFSAILITKGKITAEAAGKVYLNETDLTLELGHYKTLKVKGTNQKVTWKTANKNAATVSANGKVTAMGWGSTKIYAYVGNKTLTCKVTIVQMNKKNLTLASGNTYQLTLWGADKNVTWDSSNDKVATVSKNGLVTAVGNGTATITATYNGKKITSTVKVISLNLNENKLVLEYDGKFSSDRTGFGNVKTLKVTGTNEKVTWTSSDKKVAVVDKNGLVTAKGPGIAKITASVDGAKITCEVKVLKISSNELELSKGETYKLSVIGTSSDIKWHSYKKSVATVDENGVITAISSGTAKIVAEVDGILLRCILTVD